MGAEVLSEDPWVIRFPNFLTEEEIAFLRSKDAHEDAWEGASETGAVNELGRSTKLFSANRDTHVTWCAGACHNHPVSMNLRARIGEIMRVHPDYFESMQFLKYGVGQYYKAHNDWSSNEKESGASFVKHRVYTFFLYLNDVEEGGATYFPKLKLR